MKKIDSQQLAVSAEDARTEFERFDDGLKHLLAVPKDELDLREEEYRKQRDEQRQHKKKKPG